MTLALLAAGASKGLVLAVQSTFTAQTGIALDGTFNAVGRIRDEFLSGERCDVLILTAPRIAELTAQGLLAPGSAAPLGVVRMGVAVPAGHDVPDISTACGLTVALQRSKAVFVPDPHHSTAGIHFMNVLRKLGIKADITPHLQSFPNGAIAMHHLAESRAINAIGSTQITEIKYTAGLVFAGALPHPLGLLTVYAAAISARAENLEAARHLVALLSGPKTHDLRQESGFEPLADSNVN